MHRPTQPPTHSGTVYVRLCHTDYTAWIFRPPGTVVPGGLMFCCGFFFLFLWHFAALYLRDGSGDRPETFTHDWKCVNLDFGGLKFGGRGPPKIWGATAFFPI